MNLIEFLKQAKEDCPYEWKEIDQAIQAAEELMIDKDEIQRLFLEEKAKHKKEIKELKLKFIEDIAFIKKDLKC